MPIRSHGIATSSAIVAPVAGLGAYYANPLKHVSYHARTYQMRVRIQELGITNKARGTGVLHSSRMAEGVEHSIDRGQRGPGDTGELYRLLRAIPIIARNA